MVGDILRAEREKQGLTIDDVARETSIRDIYLEAIEKGDYDTLPGDVYAKGFIRNYSRFLQMDGDDLLQKYDEERNITKAVQPVDLPKQPEKEAAGHGLFGHSKAREIGTVQESSSKAAADNQPDKPKTNLFAAGDAYRNSLEQEKKSGSKKFMILLGVMFVFLGGIYVAFMDDGTEEAPKQQETVQTETPQPAPAEKKYDGVEITAKALADCWISVKVDGATVFEGTVPQGKDMSWQGKESVDILAGNAGGIQITFNGKDVGTLGEQGQVAERSFKKNESAAAAANAPAQQETAQPAYVESSSQGNHYSAPAEPEPQAPAVQEEAPAAAPVAEPPAASAPAPAPEPVEQSAPAPAAAAPQN